MLQFRAYWVRLSHQKNKTAKLSHWFWSGVHSILAFIHPQHYLCLKNLESASALLGAWCRSLRETLQSLPGKNHWGGGRQSKGRAAGSLGLNLRAETRLQYLLQAISVLTTSHFLWLFIVAVTYGIVGVHPCCGWGSLPVGNAMCPL